jgi:excisionase family DNA binding protein
MSHPYFKPDLTDPLLTTREVAHRLGVSMRTVQLWVDAGTLAAGRTPGGHRRIRMSAVTALAKRSGIASPASEINVHAMNAELVGALRGLVVELQDSSSREMTNARLLLARADALMRGAS